MKTALLVAALGLLWCSVVDSSGGSYGGSEYSSGGGGYGGGAGYGEGAGGERPRVNLGISLKVPAMKINLGRMNMPKISIRAKIKQSHGPKVINVPEMHIDTNSKLPAPEGAQQAGHGNGYGSSSSSYGGGSEYGSSGGSSYGAESSPSYGGQSDSSYGGSQSSGYGQQQSYKQQPQYQAPSSGGYGQQEQQSMSGGYGQQQQSGGYGQQEQQQYQPAGGYDQPQQSANYGGEQAPSQAYAQHQPTSGYGSSNKAPQNGGAGRPNRMSYMPKFSIYSPSSQHQQAAGSYEPQPAPQPAYGGEGIGQENDAMREQINAAIAAYEQKNPGGYSASMAPSGYSQSAANYPQQGHQMMSPSYGGGSATGYSQQQQAQQPQYQPAPAPSYSMGPSYSKQESSPMYEMASSYSEAPKSSNYQQQSASYGGSQSSYGGGNSAGGFSISVGNQHGKYGNSPGFQPLEPGTTVITSSNDNYSGDNKITINSNPDKQYNKGSYGNSMSYAPVSMNQYQQAPSEQAYAPPAAPMSYNGASGDLYQKSSRAPVAAVPVQQPIYDDSAVNYAAVSQGNYGARTNRAIANKHHYGGQRH